MARKRIIDPEFWSDEEIGQWSYEARLFYIGLWNFADDVGRFKAHPQLLKSQIFPYDQKFNIEHLKKELNNKVQWYEVAGLQYGYLRNFNKHQRIDKPSDSKLPKPPPFDEHSTNVPRTLPPNISKEKLIEVKLSADAPPAKNFIETLKANIAYKHINIDTELAKMDAWFTLPRNKGRQKTDRFILNWLNKIDKPISTKPEARPQTRQDHQKEQVRDPKIASIIHETVKGMR